MSTNKPLFTFYIEFEYLKKIRFIAKQEVRSVSNLLRRLCKLYIKHYEEENGEIKAEDVENMH